MKLCKDCRHHHIPKLFFGLVKKNPICLASRYKYSDPVSGKTLMENPMPCHFMRMNAGDMIGMVGRREFKKRCGEDGKQFVDRAGGLIIEKEKEL